MPLDHSYRQLARSPTEEHTEEHVEDKLPDPVSEGCEKIDIVQFTSALYYVEEHEGHLIIDVMRMGKLSGSASVSFETVDASANGEDDYHRERGLIEFAEGDHTKEIRLRLRANNIFKTTLEFKVLLSDPFNCHLGAYLDTCRVKIIDESAFPSDRFKADLQSSSDLVAIVRSLEHYTLFWEYSRHIVVAASLRITTLVIIIFDQLKNFYHLLSVYLSMYMVNTVLNTHDPDAERRLILPTRVGTLYLVAAGFLIPMLLLHVWDYIKGKLNLKGRVVTCLRVNLFRKYLNYSKGSRHKVDSGSVALSLEHDVEMLAKGYVGMCELSTVVGKLCVAFYFTHTQAKGSLWIVMMIPLVTIISSTLRAKVMLELDGAARAKIGMLSFIHDVAINYELIDSYAVRPSMVDVFEEKAARVTRMDLGMELFELNTQYFVRWLTPIMFCVYMFTQAPNVIRGEVSLGEYLALVKIIYEVGDSCFVAFEHLTGVVHTLKPLQRVVVLFNRNTDLHERKLINRKRREDTHKVRNKTMNFARSRFASDAEKEVYVKSDLMPIRLNRVTLYCPSSDRPVLYNAHVNVDQGKMVAVFGPHRSGKNSLLRLLCMKQFPSEGGVFLPMHLRVLHVGHAPLVLSLSPYENLILGLPQGRSVDHQRIQAILEKFEMVETLELVKDDLDKVPTMNVKLETLEPHELGWKSAISSTGLALLHLAMAFIANPEVIVLANPLSPYDAGHENVVLKAFRHHVDNRGLCMPPLDNNSHLRRPRTLFFSTLERRHAKFADAIWHLTPAVDGTHHSISSVSPEKWSPYTPERSTVTVTRTFSASSIPIVTATCPM